jgi:hypothetical protein
MEVRSFRAASAKEFINAWESRSDGAYKPSAAIIFSSVSIDLEEVRSYLSPLGVSVFGCTTCGEFLFDGGERNISEGELVCSMLDLKHGSFDLRLFEAEGMNSFELGFQAGKWAAETFQNPAILILGSGMTADGEQIVLGVRSAAGDEVLMFGGLAGDDARFVKTEVFNATSSSANGALVLVLDRDRYDVNGLATSGWVSIGADKVITSSTGNVVRSIDNQPALEVYMEYLNVRQEDLPEIGVEYPLMIRKEGTDPVIRAVLNVDREEKALIFAGTVPQGSVVTFASSPGFEIIESTRRKMDDFINLHPQTDILVVFSCMARHNALGPTVSEEIEDAWTRWRKPLIGFFTYGEIGSNAGMQCDFHNQTFTLVSVKEK